MFEDYTCSHEVNDMIERLEAKYDGIFDYEIYECPLFNHTGNLSRIELTVYNESSKDTFKPYCTIRIMDNSKDEIAKDIDSAKQEIEEYLDKYYTETIEKRTKCLKGLEACLFVMDTKNYGTEISIDISGMDVEPRHACAILTAEHMEAMYGKDWKQYGNDADDVLNGFRDILCHLTKKRYNRLKVDLETYAKSNTVKLA